MPVATSPLAESFRSDITSPGANTPNSMHSLHGEEGFGGPAPHRRRPGPPPGHHGGPLPPPGMPMPPPTNGGPPMMGMMGFGMTLEARMHLLNKRLLQKPENCDNIWWDQFASEFFEDDARMVIRLESVNEQDPAPPKQYSIGRSIIPRFFRTFFDNGVVELQYELRLPRESQLSPNLLVLDCEQAVQTTTHLRPTFGKVTTEGRLILHVVEETLRFRGWIFNIRSHCEFISRQVLSMQLEQAHSGLPPPAGMPAIEQFSKSLTLSGLPNAIIHFLRLCEILEPMQEVMSRHKAFRDMSPADCLTQILYHKWQNVMAPQGAGMLKGPHAHPLAQHAHAPASLPDSTDASKASTKRRKRKTSTSSASGGGNRAGAGTPVSAQNGPSSVGGAAGPGVVPVPASSKKSKAGQAAAAAAAAAAVAHCMPLASQDVMIVGEPTLMGGDFGDEDERLISRLENNQYDPALAAQLGPPPPLPGIRGRSQSQHQQEELRTPSTIQHTSDAAHFTAPSPRGRPPSAGAWQREAASGATPNRPSSTASSGNGSEKRSPNH